MAIVNFAGALPLVQYIWQKMLEQNKGVVSVVSSTTGVKARDNEAVYAGTKHAQVGFARSLGLEAARLHSSVRVALCVPGGMRTHFWSDNRPDTYSSFNDPTKVARKMMHAIEGQSNHYLEIIIERGELV